MKVNIHFFPITTYILYIIVQNLGSTGRPFLVTLNPPHIPKHKLLKWYTSHPFPSVAASKASLELDKIQGKRTIWFSGAYQGKAKNFPQGILVYFLVFIMGPNV